MMFQLNNTLDVFQVKSCKTKVLRTEMTVEEMQGRNRNKLVFFKFSLVLFSSSSQPDHSLGDALLVDPRDERYGMNSLYFYYSYW